MTSPDPAPRTPLAPALAFVATIAADDAVAADAVRRLGAALGPVVAALEPFPFDPFTDYYASEMGRGLRRSIALFGSPFDPARLAELKRAAIAVERDLEDPPGRRRVNADPGYVALRKIVLATTKDGAHRIAVGDGIFAESTLAFRDGAFAPWPWTYPDYRAPSVAAFFAAAREHLAR